jgi:hypothetical protein
MNRKLAFLSIAFVVTTSSYAQETVFRPNVKPGISLPDLIGNLLPMNGFQPTMPRACVNDGMNFNSAQCWVAFANPGNSFKVYTVDQIYRIDQVDALVTELNGRISQIEGHLATLTTANDALTKRLNDLEQKGTQSKVSIRHRRNSLHMKART